MVRHEKQSDFRGSDWRVIKIAKRVEELREIVEIISDTAPNDPMERFNKRITYIWYRTKPKLEMISYKNRPINSYPIGCQSVSRPYRDAP